MLATRHSWSNLQPLPAQRSLLYLERQLTEQEYERVCRGLIPENMEDKWFIFVEEDTLYIHRSWTGYCIYQLNLIRGHTTCTIGDAFVNRDVSQYSNSSDRDDERLVMFLIDHLLLGNSSPLLRSNDIPSGIATELHLHHLIGTGHKTEAAEIKLTLSGLFKGLWWWFLYLIKGVS